MTSSNNQRSLSHAQGGLGVGLRDKKILGQLFVPISIGQTPGPGTGCTVFLATNSDVAYDGAVVDFYVNIFGRRALFQSVTIDQTLNEDELAIALTVYGAAADFWEIYITLMEGDFPQIALQSSATSFGVERLATTIDSGELPWVEIGGVIQPVDATASLEAGGGTASPSQQAVAFGVGSIASGGNAFAISVGTASGSNTFAGAGGVAAANNSFAWAGTTSGSSAPEQFAILGGTTSGIDAFAHGIGTTASGLLSFAINSSTNAGSRSFTANTATASAAATGSAAFGQMTVTGSNQFAAGVPGAGNSFIEIGFGTGADTILSGQSLSLSSVKLSFFGVTPVVQQSGGALTAGAVYTTNEQTMLNDVWTALRRYGLLT